jgi:hypothetical protein
MNSSANILGPTESCRVFISHTVAKADVKGLAEYADAIIPIHYRWIFPGEVTFRQDTVCQETSAVFRRHGGFNPNFDYLALVGDPFICAAVIRELFKTVDFVTLLRYDKRSGGYFPLKLS